MTSQEFLEMFRELIQTDMAISMDTPLAEIAEWDSMAMMAFAAHLDARYGLEIPFDQLGVCVTPRDLGKLAPDFEA